MSSLISAVEAGAGVTLVPASMACLAGARLKLVPLSPEPKPLVIGVLQPKDGLSSTAERFLDCLKEAVSRK